MELAGAIHDAAPGEPVDTDEGARDRPPEAEGAGDAPFRDLPARDQRRLILDLLRAGKSDLEIGGQIALSQWQVRNLRYRFGLKKDRGGNLARRRAGRRTEDGEANLATAEAARARRLPRIPAGEDAGRMAVRLAGRFAAAEAGRRLSALGGLLSASDGRYEVRLAFYQLEDGSEPAT